MTKKNKTVKELNLEFELLAERVTRLESKDATENNKNMERSEKKIKRFEDILRTYDDKINELDKLINQKTEIRTNGKRGEEQSLDCRVCGEQFKGQKKLREHIKIKHPKVYACKECELTFSVSWKMEKHTKTHENVELFKCNVCDKEFASKWRMKKHNESHGNIEKFCHYFNNEKQCPYDDLGCKFLHEDSDNCKFGKYCNFNLCQFKHNQKENNEEMEMVESDGDSENDNDMEDASLTDDECSDYELVNEDELKQNKYNDCGGCGKVLRIENSYKCKKCGQASHRSNCNTWFSTVNKHHFCGGCVYDYEPKE